MEEQVTKPKKKWYKRVWVWIIAVIVLFFVYVQVSGPIERWAAEKTKEWSNDWPETGLAMMLPEPEFEKFSVTMDSENYFSFDAGETSIDEFKSYVDKCKEKGFTDNYSASDTSYRADNAEGYSLSVSRYDDEISVSLNKKIVSETKNSDNSGTVSESTASSSSSTSVSSTTDWRTFLKDYEKWVNSYVDFMKKYSENPTDSSLIADYTDLMQQLTEWSEKADEVQKSLENDTEAQLEYAAELAKIAARISELNN